MSFSASAQDLWHPEPDVGLQQFKAFAEPRVLWVVPEDQTVVSTRKREDIPSPHLSNRGFFLIIFFSSGEISMGSGRYCSW